MERVGVCAVFVGRERSERLVICGAKKVPKGGAFGCLRKSVKYFHRERQREMFMNSYFLEKSKGTK